MKKRAVLYARVSSDDRRREGRNLKGQLDMCREYAIKKDWKIVAELQEDDRGARGADFDLPKLNQALDMASAGDFDFLVTREMDRFSRKLAKQLVIEDEFRRLGVQIEYVLTDYDDTPEGELNKHVRAVIAEYERKKINERMRRGKRLKVKSGQVLVFGKAPYGYRTITKNKKTIFEIIESEAVIVRLIYTWYVVGDENNEKLSITGIARRLTEMKVPTWEDTYGKGKKQNKYGHWSGSVVANILKSETYAGVWAYNKTKIINGKKVKQPKEDWITVPVPAIIERHIWKAAQRRKNKNKQQARRNRQYEFLMAGFLTCGKCGQTITARSAKTRGKRPYCYYLCYGHRRDAPKQCRLSYFNARDVDKVAWAWVKSFLLSPQKLKEGLQAFQDDREEHLVPIYKRLHVVNQLLETNRNKLARLLDLYLEGSLMKEMLVDRRSRLETTIAALDEERVELENQLNSAVLSQQEIEDIFDFAQQAAEGLCEADENFEARRRVVELLEVRAALEVEGKEKYLYLQCGLGRENLIVASNRS